MSSPHRSHRLSMSRMSLALACSYSFRADVEVHERVVGRPALLGSAVHLLAECHVRKLPAPVLDEDVRDEAHAIANGPLLKLLDSQDWTACEIGMRYRADVDESWGGPRRGDADYGNVGRMVLPGTLDLVLVRDADALVVDIKTGKVPGDSEQLYAQAVAVSRAYGAKRVEVGYAMARKTKCEIAAKEVLEADDLDAHAGRIAKLLRRLPMAEPQTGKHCWRCDARPSCPGWLAEGVQSGTEMPPDEYFGDIPEVA